MKRVLIGVAWPYANGPIHIGQVGGCYLPPDIFRRYNLMKGREVLMVSGSDQHGTPITVQAEKEGVSPREVAEKYHKINSKALEDLGVDFTLFTYTMNETHKKVSQNIFSTLYQKDFVYLDTMETFFCPSCDRYLPDRYVTGDCPRCDASEIKGDQCDECGLLLDPDDLIQPRCMFCGGKPSLKESEHFFLKLSAFQEKLEGYIKDKDHWKSHVLNFTRSWLQEGLRDRPISRDMEWGIPVPVEGYEDKRIYVWFEAVIGYLSTSVKWAEETGGDWEEFWKDPEARHYYFLAKDNIPFHTIIWPAMLMGYDEELNIPYDVPGNQYMRFEGRQFSTSRGLIVSLPDILEKFDTDAIRYYITSIMPELRDSNFSWADFEEKNNTELVGNLGNFIHRVLSFTYSRYGKVTYKGEYDQRDTQAKEIMEDRVNKVGDSIEKCRFKDGMRALLELSREGNRYFNERAPWSEYKEDNERCETTLNVALHMLKAISVIGSPYLPFSMDTLWDYLGMEGSVHDVSWEEALVPPPEGQKLKEPKPLYKNIDIEEMFKEEQVMEKLKRLDLRSGRIQEVEEHPNADRLYVMRVDLGEEERTLVAGLKTDYSKEELKGKNVVVVANLEPAKLRGITSEAMVLAAEDDDKISLVIAEAEPGEQVEGTSKGRSQISFKEFQEYDLQVVMNEEDKLVGKDTFDAVDEPLPDRKTVALVEGGKAKVLRSAGHPLTLHREISKGSEIK